LVLGKNLLAPGGIFVFEHGHDNDFSAHPNFVEHRSYGSVNFSLFRQPIEDFEVQLKRLNHNAKNTCTTCT
jgi:hypothetical protein